MSDKEPAAELEPYLSSDDATATPQAEVYWLSTVGPDGRPHGRPHVTPLLSVWLDRCKTLTQQRFSNSTYLCSGMSGSGRNWTRATFNPPHEGADQGLVGDGPGEEGA